MMLALRLRGSRGIRTQYSGPLCHARVGRAGIAARDRPTAFARGYADDATNLKEVTTPEELTKSEESARSANSDSSAKAEESAESEVATNLKELTKTEESPKPQEPTKPSESPKSNNNPESSKSTNSKKKKTEVDGANNADKKTEPKAGDEAPSSESQAKTIKILREATALLQEFRANPAKFAAKKTGKDKQRSLKTQSTPIKGAFQYDERQMKIFSGTLNVLGDALQTVAQGGGKDKSAAADIAAAREVLAGFRPDHGRNVDSEEVKTADTAQKQSPRKEAEAEIEKRMKDKSKKKAEPQPKLESKESSKKKKGNSQASLEAQEPPKKKGQAQHKSEKSETGDAPTTQTKVKTYSKKLPLVLGSESLAAAVAIASARYSPKSQKGNKATSETKTTSDPKAKSTKKSSAKKKHGPKVENFRAQPASALTPIDVEVKPVPLIQYGLDRVLFKDGVYPLQDPRTRVWNFDPYLATIMPVTDFDFDALADYITSSKDKKLIGITKDNKKKYTGSTSSMTSTLAHFHFLLSHWRPINCARLSQQFDVDQDNFTGIMRAPAATILNYKDGVYAIDADKEWDHETVLSMLGKSMEKLLTVPKDEFVKYHRSNSHELTEEEKNHQESYHYTTFGDFMMRSQLDAYDPRLPGTGVYDLKTRAVVSIRMDAQNVHRGAGYEIRQRDGNWESFEREYFDMIRSAFLKYSLQVRMGRMDGIFVAYHNTERIFGFQYIPLEEMDLSIHGTTDKTLGDKEFTASLKLFNDLLNQATAKFPKQSLRVHVEARPSTSEVPFLYFFAEPVNDEQIKKIQEKSKGSAEKFRKKLGIPLSEKDNTLLDSTAEEALDVEDETVAEDETVEEVREVVVEEEDGDQVWQNMMDVVEDTMDKDAEGITAIREAIQQALEQSGLLRAKSSEEAQHYIEALLKSIIDPNADFAKSENKIEQDDEAAPQNAEPEPAEPGPKPKQSTISSFFSWFRSPAPDTEVATNQQVPSSTQMAETEEKTQEAADGPSPELVDLLVKLTSRVGMTSSSKIASDKAKQQELSDDQARLQSFETILLDMMPDALESPEESASETEATSVETGDFPTEAKPSDSSVEEDSIFAMYVTVRNKVNNEPVDRPDNLRSSDKWDIEYAMEELHGERAVKLYQACQKRRKMTHLPKERDFRSMFDGELPQYINAGKKFRKQEKKIAETQPVWIVGQPGPLPAAEVFKGAGVKLDHILPSLEHGRPEVGSERDFAAERKSDHTSSIEDAVAQIRKNEENRASSFKEWRAKSKQSDNQQS